MPVEKIVRTEAEWRARLTPQQYEITRGEGTERAFTPGNYNDEKRPGVYHCVGCDKSLFSSDAKYDSGTGWPSFWKPIAADLVETKVDRKLIAARTEVHCATCEGHLGHVFEDGPPPTGLRYCMNGGALRFEPKAG